MNKRKASLRERRKSGIKSDRIASTLMMTESVAARRRASKGASAPGGGGGGGANLCWACQLAKTASAPLGSPSRGRLLPSNPVPVHPPDIGPKCAPGFDDRTAVARPPYAIAGAEGWRVRTSWSMVVRTWCTAAVRRFWTRCWAAAAAAAGSSATSNSGGVWRR